MDIKQFFWLTEISKTIFCLNSGRDLHHQDIIVIKQKTVRRNLQSVNHVLVRVLNHVLGQVGMITNGRVDYRHQKPGNVVILKISLSIVVFIFNCQTALFLLNNIKLNKSDELYFFQ